MTISSYIKYIRYCTAIVMYSCLSCGIPYMNFTSEFNQIHMQLGSIQKFKKKKSNHFVLSSGNEALALPVPSVNILISEPSLTNCIVILALNIQSLIVLVQSGHCTIYCLPDVAVSCRVQ